MTQLRTEPRLDDPDALYAALMEAHRGLDDAASRRLDAKLVLILANHIGDGAVLREAVALARGESALARGERALARGERALARGESALAHEGVALTPARRNSGA